jgi:hypothetical protein
VWGKNDCCFSLDETAGNRRTQTEGGRRLSHEGSQVLLRAKRQCWSGGPIVEVDQGKVIDIVSLGDRASCIIASRAALA